MATSFSVQSSLDLSYSNFISIETPSSNSVKVAIWLGVNPSQIQAQFVNKAYSAIITTISDKKTLMNIEGSLFDINKALQQLVIDINGIFSFNGTITVNDGLNPPLTHNLSMLSDYFIPNETPVLKRPVQPQLEQVPVATGQHFTIQLDAHTFHDKNNELLEYSLFMEDGQTPAPNWISIRELTLTGTPPQQLSPRTYKFVIVAKNEFKSVSETFILDISISMGYAMKLIFGSLGYVITAIGFLFYASQIYNVLMKKAYRYKKNLFIGIGEEITDSTIFPFAFIRDEIKESKVIFKELEKFVADQLNVASVDKLMIAGCFLNLETNQIDKQRVIEVIKEVVVEMSNNGNNRAKLYVEGTNFSRETINELIFNEVVMSQLRQITEKPTKEAFNKIIKSNSWIYLIEWNDFFIINQMKLYKELLHLGILGKSSSSKQDAQEYLLENTNSNFGSISSYKAFETSNINSGLLEQAICAHAFQYHNLNIPPQESTIVSKYLVRGHFLIRRIEKFLKLDLELIPFTEKNEVGFGIHYKLKKNTNVLSFYGTAWENIKDKTIVIQIANREKIYKELWIYGVEKTITNQGEEMVF